MCILFYIFIFHIGWCCLHADSLRIQGSLQTESAKPECSADLRLGGFHNPSLNGVFRCDERYPISNREVYWKEDYSHFIYLCEEGDQQWWTIADRKFWDEFENSACGKQLAYKSVSGIQDIHDPELLQDWVEAHNGTTKTYGGGVKALTCSAYLEQKICEQRGCMWSATHKHQQCSAKWAIWGEAGPQCDDVKQGALGTCYFMATLAAIGHSQPHLIKHMFKNKVAHAIGLYMTRWWLGGKPVNVIVDTYLPCDKKQKIAFAQPAQSSSFWPAILEKSWAKLFRSYMGINAGFPWEALAAITGVPVDIVSNTNVPVDRTDGSARDLWSYLVDAAKKQYPILALSGFVGAHGLVGEHVWAVLNASTVDGERRLHMYNPWGFNIYSGSLASQSTRTSGHFWMTLTEYLDVFDHAAVALVQPQYFTSFTSIPVGSLESNTGFPGLSATLVFELSDPEQFSVQLHWPMPRFMKASNCGNPDPEAEMNISNGRQIWTVSNNDPWRKSKGKSNLHIHVPQGGKFSITVKAVFPYPVDDVTVHVYAAEKVKLEVQHSKKEEYRADGHHGKFTENEFLLFYGSLDQWDRAKKSSPACRPLSNSDLDMASVFVDVDKHFLPNMQSIGDPTATCSDAAQGPGGVPCEQFNQWQTIQSVMGHRFPGAQEDAG